MFAKTAVIALFATFAAAAPTTRAASDITKFDALSAHSTTVVHLQSITASNNRFYLDGTSSAHCPTDQCPAIDCSQYTNSTIFSFDTTGTILNLDAVVPGGQQVWVEPTGELAYQVAGDSSIPSTALLSPFTYTPPAGTDYVGELGFNGKGFDACPISTGGYQVFAAGVAGYTPAADCISINIITSTWTGADAYEY